MYVSSLSDDADADTVSPSHWNDGHVLTGFGTGLVDAAYLNYTAGDITCTANNVWENMPSVGTITLNASTGDLIEAGASFGVFNTTAQSISFDIATVVSGSPVHHLSDGGAPNDSNFGISAWRVPASAQGSAGGSVMYTLQSSDISGGTVTLQLRDHPEGSTDRVVNASATRPLHFWAKNLGQGF
ncbi:MAG TPA: hypothetical protein VFX15_02935 [Actinomycetes bacterium]|nr:hypothetical protein [Actinomycetes bacterium]